MRDYVILTDGACDLGREARETYGIEYIPATMLWEDKEVGQTVSLPTDLDWGTVGFKEFYDMMRHGVRIRTALIPPEVYQERFEEYLGQGKDVLYLGCSSALSGTVGCAMVAAKRVNKKYKQERVVCVDTLAAHTSLGLICVKAAEMKGVGKDKKEVARWVERHRNEANLIYTADSLKYVWRAGRVKLTKAVLGGLLMFKPIVAMGADGMNLAVGKVRGRKKSLARIVEMMAERWEGDGKRRVRGVVVVGHGDAEEEAEKVKAMAEERLKEMGAVGTKVVVEKMGPIIGASAGPGTISLAFWGKKVQERAEN